MSPELLLVAAGVFLAVALTVGLAGLSVLNRFVPERLRLEQVAVRTPLSAPAGQGSVAREGRSSLEERLEQIVPKSPKEMGRLQRQLAMAGYQGYLPAALFALAEITLPILFAVMTIAVLGFGSGLLVALLLAVVGYILPGIYLSRVIRLYKKRIRNGLADALDLLIVCVEAGSGLDQSLVKASEELAVSHPELARELSMIITEVRAGKPRLEAFKNFAERTKVDDVQSLVSMLVQTDRFGTSISQALRTYADVLRSKRRQRAEEKAAKLGVKLVFPLVLCLFPAMYVVTLGPMVITIVRVFLGW